MPICYIRLLKQENVLRNNDTLSISPEWSAVGFWFRNLLDAAVNLGYDRDRLLKDAGLEKVILTHLERHYPIADFFRLLRLISQQYKEPDIGIHYILNGHPCALGLLGMAVYTSATLREAWETVFRFRHLVMNTGNSKLLDEGDTTCMRWYPYSRAIVTERYFVDAVVAGWVLNSSALTGKPIRPISVELTYKKPVITPLFQTTYGENVRFGQPYNSITFRREDMETPLRYADKKVHRLLCAQAEQDATQFKVNCPFSEKVEYEIRQQLANGEATVETVAEKMHVAPRTLQRRLTRENSSFHELLANVRHELALFYLQEESLSILDIAVRLGYNQASSFCTAFKSWTGQTPSEYRGVEIQMPQPVDG